MLKKESNIYTQTGANSQQIGTQNNIFNSIKTFRPLTNYRKKIKIRKQITDNQNMFFYGFTSYGFIIIFLYYFSKQFSNSFQLNLFSFSIFSQLLIEWSFVVILFIVNFFILSIILRQGKLKIKKNEIKLYFFNKNIFSKNIRSALKQKTIILNYQDIRSILKQKTIVGYAIFICKKDEILPFIQFNVDSLHVALAIEELITNKISKVENERM